MSAMAFSANLCPSILSFVVRCPSSANLALQCPSLSINLVRNMSGRRDKLYGFEEGHSNKNEVRKETWIRKRYRKTMGQQWYFNENKYLIRLIAILILQKFRS